MPDFKISRFILFAAGAAMVASAAAANTASDNHGDWQSKMDQAEPLYKDGRFKEALALYKAAAAQATTRDTTAAEKIKSLRYLADCYCHLNQPDEALAEYKQVSALLDKANTVEVVDNLNDQAVCFGLKHDLTHADALCRQALQMAASTDNKWQLARTQAHIAYLDYLRTNYDSAVRGFQTAQQTLDASGRSDIPAMVLRQKLSFAQAGSYYHLKRYRDAYQQFHRMYDFNSQLFGKTNLQTGWSMLAMSDALDKIGDRTHADDWYRKAIYVFRKYNADRLTQEYKEQSNDPDIAAKIQCCLFGKTAAPVDLTDSQPPVCSSSCVLERNHDPCSLYARPFYDAPGRVWLNPLVKQHGLILAIHGLSLQHSAYDAFAKQLADAGFCTVAFDVRGFGVYQQAMGADHLDFDGAMRDLQLVARALHTDIPNLPLFVLGESMGGAIALQFAAQNSDLVEGLIASVPAGKRFNNHRTAIKVALRYIDDKNKPFDIGTDVINQATSDPTVKQSWANDPLTRGQLSARELLEFQLMCNRNLEYAKQVQALPVILFQGVSDGLVKPEATYDLFRAISSKDKSLVMVGNAEHLIFEEGCFTPAVLKGLVAWMESHIKAAKS